MNHKTPLGTWSSIPHDLYHADRAPRENQPAVTIQSQGALPTSRVQHSDETQAIRRKLGAMSLVGLLGTLLIANIGVALFIKAERVVYFWDSFVYWGKSPSWAGYLHEPIGKAVKALLHSLAHHDYNILPAVPIGTWLAIAGPSRLAYTLGIVNLYAGSAILGMMALTRCFWGEREARQGPWVEIIPAAVLLLFPTFWVPILRGSPDVGGVVIAFAVLWLYFMSTRRGALHPAFFGIGIMLGGLYLFRRWYAFWVVSFLVVAAFDRMVLVCQDWLERGFSLRRTLRILLPIPVMGGTMGLVLVSLALPMLRRVVSTNYADIYSAYSCGGSIYGELSALTEQRVGLAPLLYVLAGVVGLLVFADTRRMSLFTGLQGILIFLHFTSVQSFGPHHVYLLLPSFLLIVSVFTLKMASLASPVWTRAASLGAVLAMALGVTAFVFYEPARSLTGDLGPWAPTEPCYPTVRSDVPEMGRMLSVLDGYLQKSDGRVYVLASSVILNSEILQNASISLPLTFRSQDRVIARCSHVDKRDGFPKALLKAEFVIVTSPIQYHLRPADQQVIVIPAESFLNQTDIGKAFELLPESFLLENGTRTLLFRKKRPINPTEVAQLSERLRAAYPDRPFIYQS